MLLDRSGITTDTQGAHGGHGGYGVVVVHKVEHQLPIAVITFQQQQETAEMVQYRQAVSDHYAPHRQADGVQLDADARCSVDGVRAHKTEPADARVPADRHSEPEVLRSKRCRPLGSL